MLFEWKSDLMFFSETWLRPFSVVDSSLSVENFFMYRRDRCGRSHGGLLVYVKNSLPSSRRHDLEDDRIECITIELLTSDIPHIFFCCYRPPDQPVDTFFGTLSELVSNAECNSAALTILGDFNAKHQSWDPESTPNSAGTRLHQLLTDFSFSQLVDTPTRVSSDGNNFSTIDLICTTRPDLVQDINVSDAISDHCCVTAHFAQPQAQHTQPRSSVSFPDLSATDWHAVRNALYKSNLLEAVQGTSDINIAWATWKSIVLAVLQRHVPMRTVVSRSKNNKWMTSALHKLSRKRKRLFCAAKRSRSPTDWSVYTKFRNKCTDAFRKAKADYFARRISHLERCTDGSQRWWRIAKDLARLNPSKNSIPDLDDGGTLVSSEQDKAELLAQHFAKQCTYHDSDGDHCGAPFPLTGSHPKFDFQPVPQKVTLFKLKHLPVSKATADPLLSNRTLRECAPCISSSITYLFNLSLSTNVFPSEWKQAIVTPLFKQRGNSSNPSNYRPVSLLHAVGKVLDSIVSECLLNYLLEHSLINDHQHGFLRERSTVTQLIYVINKWIRAMDSGHYHYAVFMDFMKAFDRVWHAGLLHKLLQCGVSIKSIPWFSSYLSQRSLRVRVGKTFSNPYSITAGVPQGSHLGPILFLVFINDLPQSVGVPMELFADDALLNFQCSLSDPLSSRDLQSAIEQAESWALSWHGRFGHSKTKILRVLSSRIPFAVSSQPERFFIDGKPITLVDAHLHLGVTLTSDLSWKDHISNVVAKCSRKSGLLKWMMRELPSSVIEKLYLCYLRPSLEYAAPVWHGSVNESDAMLLERIQCSVARSLLKERWDTPKDKLLQDLGWPSLRWRREIISMTVFFRLLQSRPRKFLGVLPVFVKDVVDRARRKPYQLVLPDVNSSRHLNSFFVRSAVLWNTLPHTIQSQSKVTQFRNELEEHWYCYKFRTVFNLPLH